MEFRILGPLEVSSDTGDVQLGGAQKRALLAVLLLHANEAVSVERLVDELWPESPPKTAEKTVRVYVSQLRNALDDGRLERHGRGYMLRLDGDDLDAARFEALLTEGRDQLAAGEPDRAAVTLTNALALWRGPPLADFAYEPFAQTAIARLEQRRLVCLEERIEADLALARHEDVIAELEELVRDHPLRERLRGQLMLALYRSGRQAEALEVYRDGRRLLVDELGIEPGEELRRLERAILEQDASLAGPAAHERASGVPSGTVTFLFTDIEGSTQLLHQLGRDRLRGDARRARAAAARLPSPPTRGGWWTRRAIRSSSPSARLPTPSRPPSTLSATWRPSAGRTGVPSECAWACTRVSRGWASNATSGSASIAPRVSARPATAARCCSLPRRGS